MAAERQERCVWVQSKKIQKNPGSPKSGLKHLSEVARLHLAVEKYVTQVTLSKGCYNRPGFSFYHFNACAAELITSIPEDTFHLCRVLRKEKEANYTSNWVNLTRQGKKTTPKTPS